MVKMAKKYPFLGTLILKSIFEIFFCDFLERNKKIVWGEGGHEVGKNGEKWIFLPETIFSIFVKK